MGYEARNQGYLIPDMRNLLTDIIPECQGQPTDRRVALRINESVDLDKFSPDETTPTIKYSFITTWTESMGRLPSLEMDCLLVNEALNLIDVVSSVHKESTCGGVVRATVDDDGSSVEDVLHLNTSKVDAAVTYIAFYVCPRSTASEAFTTSGHEISLSSAQFSCQLCDMDSRREICSITSDDVSRAVDGSNDSMPSCLVGLLFTLNGKWYFQNASVKAPSEMVQDNINHFKKYVTEKRVLLTRTQVNSKMMSNVKRYGSK